MRAYEIRQTPEMNSLEIVDRRNVTPGPVEVVVRVHAVSLNYRDLTVFRGKYGKSKIDGRVPCSDGAGEIIAVGDGVTNWKLGDRVAGCFFQNWAGGRPTRAIHDQALGGSIDGMLAEAVVLAADGIVRFPSFLSYEEAACLPCAAVTAWNGLFTRGNLQSGESVLVLGTGGVSIFALQFAARMGATIIATSSSDEKLARAREMGASMTVNYKTTPDWDKEVWALTEKRGVDHIVEVGGAGTIEKSAACIAPGGHIAMIGVLAAGGGFNPFLLVPKNARMDGIYVGCREDFEAMNQFIERRHIRPVIDKVFAFEDAPAAYKHLESGAHFGKVVITLPPSP